MQHTRFIYRNVGFIVRGWLVAAFVFIAAACNSAPKTQPTAVQQTSSPPTLDVPATDTLVPSPTPEPPLVILLAPPGSDANQTQALQSLLAELSAQEGLRFETRSELLPAGLSASVRLVVVLPPDPGLAGLAASSPVNQFLAVGVPSVQASGNVSTLAAQGTRPDREGFLAGYLAAVITDDWRVGVISRSDTPAGQAAQLSFINGVIFYCGLCRPVFPPFYQYPLVSTLPGGVGSAHQQAAADAMINSGVKTVYVYPGTGDDSLLQYLAQAGVNLIGGAAYPPEVQNQWVASIAIDMGAAIRQAWPGLLQGQGGMSLEAPLVLVDWNEALFSPGRQRLVERLLADLVAGYIDTFVDPLTGQSR